MTAAVDQALKMPGLERITVIGPAQPAPGVGEIRGCAGQLLRAAGAGAAAGQKLRNLLHRARRELSIVQGRRLENDHTALVQRYRDERRLAAGTRHIFGQLPRYIEASAGSLVVSGRLADGRLAAFAVGEFAPLATAFFMFCFRDPEVAPPGSADLVLSWLLEEAHAARPDPHEPRPRSERRHRLLQAQVECGAFSALCGSELGGDTARVHFKAAQTCGKERVMKKKTKATGGEGFREPGFWETVQEAVFGARRPLDCIQVEVTSRCPGRCSYCPHTTQRENWLSRDMDMEAFGRLWPLMRRAGRVHLQGWGEPLLNPVFFDMAALARNAGCQVSTTTCGLRMDPELALRIVESGIDIVAFSLAGTDTASNASRLGVDFDRVCEAVSTLQAVRRERMGVHLEIHFAYLMLASTMEAVRRPAGADAAARRARRGHLDPGLHRRTRPGSRSLHPAGNRQARKSRRHSLGRRG